MSDRTLIVLQIAMASFAFRAGNHPLRNSKSALWRRALVIEIVKAVPRDVHGAALIDQIIAAARARRFRDPTNAERQRRFRQRRALKKFSEAVATSKVKTASS